MFLEIKNKWHVSLQAALRRSRDLGAISDSSYRWGMVDLSKRGYRLNEPGEFQLGAPMLLRQAMNLVKDKLTLEEIASTIHMLPGELACMLRMQNVSDDTILALKKNRDASVRAKIVKFTPRS